MTSQAPDVRVGQVWQDWDVRYRDKTGPYQRFGTVIEVTDTHCQIQWRTHSQGGYPTRSGHTSRVKLSRMRPTSTGYKLVKDVAFDPSGSVPPVARHVLGTRLQTLLLYAPDVSLAAALRFLADQDVKRPECLCAMEFAVGSCTAHPWRGTFSNPSGSVPPVARHAQHSPAPTDTDQTLEETNRTEVVAVVRRPSPASGGSAARTDPPKSSSSP